MSRSAERAKSIAETSVRSLPQPNGPSTNSIVGRQSPRSLGSACAQETSLLPRPHRAMARLARTSAGEEFLHLAFARIAAADAHALAGRRRIDVEARSGRELRHRIDVRHVEPMGAAIERHAEGLRVGDAAAADVIGRLDHHEAALGGGDTARRRDAGGAGAHDDDIDVARGRNGAEGGARRERGGAGEEGTAAQCWHGFQMLITRGHLA